MRVFKRLAVIVSTLAITSFASNQANREQVLTSESEAFHKLGMKLYQQGCGTEVHLGVVTDPAKCLAAIVQLTEATILNPTLVSANLKLSKLYYYQPSQLGWGLRSKNKLNRFKLISYRYAINALEYAPNNEEAQSMLELHKTRRPAQVQTIKK